LLQTPQRLDGIGEVVTRKFGEKEDSARYDPGFDNPDANMSKTLEGGCLCVGVRYRISGEILTFQYCHCSRCRKFTGSAHAANLFTGPGDLEWLAGADSVGTYMLDAQPSFPTAFCQTCGSSLPSMSSTGKYWVVPAGTLDQDPGIKPARSIFWGSRAAWYEDVAKMPRHDALP